MLITLAKKNMFAVNKTRLLMQQIRRNDGRF